MLRRQYTEEKMYFSTVHYQDQILDIFPICALLPPLPQSAAGLCSPLAPRSIVLKHCCASF